MRGTKYSPIAEKHPIKIKRPAIEKIMIRKRKDWKGGDQLYQPFDKTVSR